MTTNRTHPPGPEQMTTLNVLSHVAIGVGNVIGVAIRIGHGEVTRSCPKPSMDTATPIRGIPAVGPARYRQPCLYSSRVHQAEGAGQVAFHVWPLASPNDAGPESRLVRSVINPGASHLSWMWPRCRTRRNPRVPRDLVGRLTVRIGLRDQHDHDRDRRHQHAGARNEQPSTECHARRGSGGGWRAGAMAGYSAPGQTSLPRTHGASTSTAPTAWTRPPAPSPNQARCTIRCLRPGRRADPPVRYRSCSAGRRAHPRRQPRRPTVTTPRSSTRHEGVCPSIRDNPSGSTGMFLTPDDAGWSRLRWPDERTRLPHGREQQVWI